MKSFTLPETTFKVRSRSSAQFIRLPELSTSAQGVTLLSFKVIWGHQLPVESLYATSYCSSIVTVCLSSIIGRKSTGFRRFIHPGPVWSTRKEGSPGTSGVKVGIKKLESLGFRHWKLHDPMVISFDALPACDGQTDTPPIAKLHVA